MSVLLYVLCPWLCVMPPASPPFVLRRQDGGRPERRAARMMLLRAAVCFRRRWRHMDEAVDRRGRSAVALLARVVPRSGAVDRLPLAPRRDLRTALSSQYSSSCSSGCCISGSVRCFSNRAGLDDQALRVGGASSSPILSSGVPHIETFNSLPIGPV